MKNLRTLLTILAMVVAFGVARRASAAECHYPTYCTHGVERCTVLWSCNIPHYEYICWEEFGHCCEQQGTSATDFCGETCDAGGVGCGT
jgi:hypothetical protein